MADPIPIKVRVTEFAPYVYEVRTVVRGRFYKRQYVGYSKQNALKLFGNWIRKQI